MMLVLASCAEARQAVIYDMHENVAGSLKDRGYPRILPWLYDRLLRVAEENLCIILAEDSYREVVSHPWPVVHNFPILEPLPPLAREKQMIYVGDVGAARGALEMLRAFALAALNSWKLVIVGPCREPGLMEKISAEADRLGIADRLDMVGRVPPGELHNYLSRASVGLSILHPERNYLKCPPTKVFQYVACGLPAIVSDFPEYRRTFGRFSTVTFVNPTDIEAVARAMRDIALRLPSLLDACRSSSNECAQRFDWSAEGIRLARAVEALLNSNSGGSEGRRRFQLSEDANARDVSAAM